MAEDIYKVSVRINGKNQDIDLDEFNKKGHNGYAEEYPDAVIRMRNKDNEDYAIPLSEYNAAYKSGLRPYIIRQKVSEPKPVKQVKTSKNENKPVTYKPGEVALQVEKESGLLPVDGDQKNKSEKENPYTSAKPVGGFEETRLYSYINHDNYGKDKVNDFKRETDDLMKVDVSRGYPQAVDLADETMRRTMPVFSNIVSQSIKESKEKAGSEADKELRSSIPTPGSAYLQAMRYNKKVTPSAILDNIKDKIAKDQNFANMIREESARLEIDPKEYATRYALPTIQKILYNQLIEENVPKSTAEYIFSNAMSGSILGMLVDTASKPLEQRQLEYEARGKYNASTAEDVASTVASIAMDLPVMGVTGGLGNAASKTLLRGQVNRMMSAGLTRESAEGIATRAAQQTGMKWGLRSVSEGVNFGAYEGLGNVLSQLHTKDEIDASEAGTAMAKGMITGAAMGIFGVGNESIGRALSTKIGDKASQAATYATSLGGRTAILAGSSVLGQWASDPNFNADNINWTDEFIHAGLTNLGFDIIGAAKRIGKSSVKLRDINLTKEDIRQLNEAGINGSNAKEIAESIIGTKEASELSPDNKMGILPKEWSGIQQEYNISNSGRRFGEILCNENIDLATKSKIGYLMTGQLYKLSPSTGLSESRDENTGEYIIDTYNTSGQRNERRRFSTAEEAAAYKSYAESEVKRNQAEAFEDILNAYSKTRASIDVFNSFVDEGISKDRLLDVYSRGKNGEKLSKEDKSLFERINTEIDNSVANDSGYGVLKAKNIIMQAHGLTESEFNKIRSKSYNRMSDVEKQIYDDYINAMRDVANPSGRQTSSYSADMSSQSEQAKYYLGNSSVEDTNTETVNVPDGPSPSFVKPSTQNVNVPDGPIARGKQKALEDYDGGNFNAQNVREYSTHIDMAGQRLARYFNNEQVNDILNMDEGQLSDYISTLPVEQQQAVEDFIEATTQQNELDRLAQEHIDGIVERDNRLAQSMTGEIPGKVILATYDGKDYVVLNGYKNKTGEYMAVPIERGQDGYIDFTSFNPDNVSTVKMPGAKFREFSHDDIYTPEQTEAMERYNNALDGQYNVGDNIRISVDGENILNADVLGIDTTDKGAVRGYVIQVDGENKPVTVKSEEISELTQNAIKADYTKRYAAIDEQLSKIKAQQESEGTIQVDENTPVVDDNTTTEGQKDNESVTDTQEVEETKSSDEIPVDEAGEPLFYQVPPERTIRFLQEESGFTPEQSNEFINTNISELTKALSKAEKNKPKIISRYSEYKRKLNEWESEYGNIKTQLDYWTDVQSRIAAQKSASAQPQQVSTEDEKNVPDMSVDKASDARNRGFRMVNGFRVDRQPEITGVPAGDTQVRFSTRDVVPAEFVVMEAEQVQPSHVGGTRNPLYFITEAQPKERTDKASQVAAERIAKDINPQEITSGGTAYTGAPVVNGRGEVIQGNNRASAIKTMYAEYPDSANKYREYVKSIVEGSSREAVDKMKYPVLVRSAKVPDEEAIKLGQMTAKDTESGGKERIEPKQVFTKLGDSISSFSGILLRSGDDDDKSISELITENGIQALKFLASKKVISDTQYQSAIDKNGNLTPDGKQDLFGILENTLFDGGIDMLPKMFESVPAKAQKAILQTFARDMKSPEESRIKTDIQKSIEIFYDAMQDEAFSSAKDYESASRAIDTWKRQKNMYTNVAPQEIYSNFALELAARMKSSSTKQLMSSFNSYYDMVQGQKDLFSNDDVADKDEALKKLFNVYGSKRTDIVESDGNVGNEGRPGSTEATGSEEPVINGERREDRRGTAEGGSINLDGQRTITQGSDNQNTGDVAQTVPVQGNESKESGTESGSQTGGDVPERNGQPGNAEYSQENSVPERNEGTEGETIEEQITSAEAEGKTTNGNNGLGDNDRIGTGIRSDARQGDVHAPHGIRLSAEKVSSLLLKMEANATQAPSVELTEETWNNEFPDGKVNTPLGVAKLGENQLAKLFLKKRQDEFGMLKPTLEHPDMVIIEPSEAKEGQRSERDSSYLFVKTFIYGGKKVKYYTSVTVKQDGMEVVISNHISGRNAIEKKMQNYEILHLDEKYSLSSSDGHLAEHSESVPDLLPTQRENAVNGGNTFQTVASQLNGGTLSENKYTNLSQKDNVLEAKIAEEEKKVDLDPTDAQKEAGNYKKGHLKFDGLDFTIENVKGGIRSGKDRDGKEWSVKMNNTYGYIRGTEGVDGDHIDMFISEHPTHGNVYVIDQVNPDGTFDEHKVMYGFPNEDEAKAAYLANYSDGWKGLGNVTEVSREEFKKWIDSSKRKTKPFSEYKSVKPLGSNEDNLKKVQDEDSINDIRFRLSDNDWTSEESQIITDSKQNGTFMKAPNGKDTNLTEKQWVQVRTKAFKNWFGDWEKAARIEKLRKSEPVRITGKEIEPSNDLKQYKKNALEYGKSIRGEYKNKDTGEIIHLTGGNSRGGIIEILQHDYKDIEHLQSIAAIPKIIENAIFIDELPNEDKEKYNGVSSFRYYVCGLNIGGEDYTVKSVIAVQSNGDRYYDHKLTSLEKGKLLDQINDQAVYDETINPEIQKSGNVSEYKDKRLSSLLQVNSSKVVDENGEPKVVYHGTPLSRSQITPNRGWQSDGLTYVRQEAPFNTFKGGEYSGLIFTSVDEDKAMSIAEKRAMSIPDDENGNEQWTEEGYVYSLYLNSRNPFDAQNTAALDKVLSSFNDGNVPTLSFYGGKGDNASVEEAKKIAESKNNSWIVTETPEFISKVKSLGYDGLKGYDEGVKYIAVTEPFQIKSATENNGEFNSSDPDIRFRFIGEKGASRLDAEEEVTTRLDNLSVARDMERKGKSAKSVKLATGWERGSDGLWRYETLDIEYHPKGDARKGSILKNRPWYDEYMQLVNKILDGEPLTDEEQKRYDGFYEKEKEAREQYDNTEKIYLDDYVKDDELFKAYPELKQTRVVFERKDGNESGSYSEKENVIRINVNSDIDAESTLVHEIQHSIQRIEGFSTGGNYKSVLNFFADHPEVEMNFVVNETYKEAKRKGIDVSKDELRRMFTESDDVAEGIENDVIERNGITESELGEIYNSGVDAGYRSIAGEVEARNVQSRMGMTMNERLGSLAEETEDVAREDQIVLDRMVSHVMSMMDNKEKGLNWLSSAKSNSQAIANQALSSAVKIVKDFENPKVSGVNLRQIDGTASSSYEEMDILDRYMNETRNRILHSPAPVIAESGKDIYAEMPDLSPIQLSRVIVAANNENVRAMYVPYTKQIVLLPKHGTAKEINDAYFHESVHFAIDMILPKGEEGRLTLERAGEEAKELDPRLAEWIDKNYNSNKSEEMVAHILENYFSYLDDKGKQDKLKAGVDFGSRYPVMNELSNNIINFLTTEKDGKIQSNGRRIEGNARYDREENQKRSNETDTPALRGEQGEGEIKLAIKGKPRKKAGESEIEFYRRLREWEKQQEEIDKNSGTKAEPTTQYYTTLTEDLRRAQNRIDTQNIVINELEKLLKRHEEGKDVREAISSMVKRELSTGTISEFNKRELTSILSQMNKSVTGTKQEATEKAIMAIENIVNEAQARYVQRLIDRMLSLKVQDVNGKNMSIAKNVDDSTRKILSFIKGSSSDLRTSGYEDEMRYLRSQNLSSRQDIEALERKIKLSDDEAEKEELQKEIDELNGIISANNEKLEDLNNEIESILKSKADITDRDIETELNNLYEKMDRAAEGNAVWTISDNERMTSLLLLKQVRDYQKTDSQAVDIEDQIRQEFLNRTELYRKRAKEAYSENRQKLTEAIKNKTIRIRALTESMNALKKQKVDMMIDFSEELRNIISGGKDSLRRKIEEENERRGMLIINTLKDITGDKEINIQDNKPRTENWFKKFIFSPLYSFEFLAKIINVNTLGEDGFFYNYFVKGENGVIEAYNTYQRGIEYARDQLDMKCAELFGKNFDKVSGNSDKVVGNSGVYITDYSKNEKYEKPLSKGQAMYIYMVWKMKDGRSKLELQGFTDDSIEDIKSFIGDNYIKLADWIQEELLPELREKYNQRYVEIFNTSLDKVENYVPLRIREEAVRQDVELTDETKVKNTLGNKARSLIRRVVNVKPVDITMSAFDVIMGHLNEMEEWYAYARVRKDLESVLSNNRIRNQINTNMHGMFNNLKEAAAVATRAHTPKTGGFLDVALGKLSKGIIGGNIAFRVSTALKQVLSAPAFFGYSQSPLFINELVKSMSHPINTYKWALENFPSFRDRLRQNNAGNEKLNDDDKLSKWMEKYIEVGMWPNKMIDAITCAIGAKSIYEYKLKRLTDSGTPREEAERKAKAEADVYYNGTQQSSHPLFLSPMQMSRSAVDRLMTTYQNSNIGYVRKVVSAYMDLKKSMDYNRILNEYKSKYIDEGMTPDEAEKKARVRIYNANKKHITGILLFGWGLNKLWEIGSLGLLGFIHSDDGDTREKNPLAKNITTYITSPLKGLPFTNVAENFIQGRDINPVFVFNELNDFKDEAKEIAEMYGVLSPELAYSILERGSTLSGVDLETWANVYTGVEDLVKNGATWDNALIDIMYVANFPRSNRLQVARELYKNADKEQYLERVSHAGNYIVPSAKLRTYIPGAIELSTTKAKDLEKQYELLNMTEEEREKYHALQTLTKVVLEDKELNKEWDENKDAETRREIAKKMYKNYSDENKNRSIETLIGASSIVYVGPVSDKEESRYLELSSYDDIMNDIRLKGYIADKKEFSDKYNQLLKDGKKDEAEQYYKDNSDNIRLYKAAFKYGQRINKLKKSLNKGNDNDVIDEIRRTRNSFFDEFK